MALVQRIAVFLLVTLSASAQSHVFDTISVKQARSSDPQSMRVRVLPDGRLTATAVPVITLISYAYSVPSNASSRLFSLPTWAYGERYDIEARAATRPMRISVSDGSAQKLVQQMFRQVLVERFRLSMQVENRRMPVYALAVARNGSKLKQSSTATQKCIFDTAPDGCHSFVIGFGHPLNAKAVDMDDLARYIENWTDLPVVNQTALAGLFSVSTEGWRPMRLPPPPPNGAGNVDFTRLPSIDTVLGRLGLKLHPEEGVLPVYTVGHIERPSPPEER